MTMTMTTNSERPIPFIAPMVRAILSGTKTQTRPALAPGLFVSATGAVLRFSERSGNITEAPCPYWRRPGDRLWVRETWAAPHAYDHLPPRLILRDARIHYSASEDRGGLIWRRSSHMPRWASRILLDVTEVRIERLQDISEADAIAEGIESLTYGGLTTYRNYSLTDELAEVSPMLESPLESCRTLWESINGIGSWDENPMVWVVGFKRAQPSA